MTRNRPITLLAGAAAVALVALVVAGCGGGGGNPTAAKAGGATINVADGGLGKILVDSKGRTLYLFKKDSGTKSTCFGECAADWPPLRSAGKPTAGNGANASLVATTQRSDGRPEVTYNGHPVYLFGGDKQPGDMSGQGLSAFGGGWSVVSPQGTEISGQPSSGRGSSTGGGNVY